jgi:hypothetical protein
VAAFWRAAPISTLPVAGLLLPVSCFLLTDALLAILYWQEAQVPSDAQAPLQHERHAAERDEQAWVNALTAESGSLQSFLR